MHQIYGFMNDRIPLLDQWIRCFFFSLSLVSVALLVHCCDCLKQKHFNLMRYTFSGPLHIVHKSFGDASSYMTKGRWFFFSWSHSIWFVSVSSVSTVPLNLTDVQLHDVYSFKVRSFWLVQVLLHSPKIMNFIFAKLLVCLCVCMFPSYCRPNKDKRGEKKKCNNDNNNNKKIVIVVEFVCIWGSRSSSNNNNYIAT